MKTTGSNADAAILTVSGSLPYLRGVQLIAAERQRQIAEEHWTPAHDARYEDDELVLAAVCYALPNERREYAAPHFTSATCAPTMWPFDEEWWKPSYLDRVRDLVKVGALIAAEIDRLLAETDSGAIGPLMEWPNS